MCNQFFVLPSGHIPAEKLVFGEVIGEGEFGSVFKGKYTDFNGQEVSYSFCLRMVTNHLKKTTSYKFLG